MPFLAQQNGRSVLPPQVTADDPVTCPACGDQMRVREAHDRAGTFVARHFYHVTDDETGADCGGESPPHLRMKSIAYSKLATEYPDADVAFEHALGDRRADILVTFQDPRAPFGRGIAVEVQHRHEGKDVEEVTDEYLDQDFSVLWLTQSDFDGMDVDLSGIHALWPHGLTHDFAEGYHGVVKWLTLPRDVTCPVRVEFPEELLEDHREEYEAVWKTAAETPAPDDDGDDRAFWWLSMTHERYQKWVKITESPTGTTMLQVGKQHAGTEQVTAPVALENQQNRNQVHALAYAVEDANTAVSSWTDLKEAWLETGSRGQSVLLKLVATPSGDLALSLMKSEDQSPDSELVTVAVDSKPNLRTALHELANELG